MLMAWGGWGHTGGRVPPPSKVCKPLLLLLLLLLCPPVQQLTALLPLAEVLGEFYTAASGGWLTWTMPRPWEACPRQREPTVRPSGWQVSLGLGLGAVAAAAHQT